MPGSARPAVIDGQGGTGDAGAARLPDRPDPGPAWLPLIPAALTLLIGLYQIQRPSFSRDETATLAAVHRSFPQLVRMLGTVDVVHGAYYALIWVVVRAGGSGEFVLRLPSAVALAVTAALVTALGRRLVSSWAGLAAGLAFAVLPPVSWFAETAREGALVAALGTLASYCLVRALQAEAGRRRWITGYGVSLAFLGLANLFALLIVLAHAITLAVLRRRYRVGRELVLGWLIAAAAALVVLSPVAVAGYGQLHQIHWLKPPGLGQVLSVQRIIGPSVLFLLTVAVCLAGLAAGRSRLTRYWPAGLLALSLPWLILPPVILLLASLVHPVYTYRYIVYCIPAAALLIGAAVAALGRYAGPVALVLIVVAGLHAQVSERYPAGHGINIRAADRVVARHAEPGDALLNISAQNGPAKGSGERTLEGAYPYGLARLHDVSRGVSPQQSATLGGTYAPSSLIRQRLARVSRLWVVEWNTPKPVLILHGLGFTLVHSWEIKGHLWLRLFVARGRS
ncbi:MAG TPA: glycosyltransferase family 39 protein [Streptosporangiaceae bacterium]